MILWGIGLGIVDGAFFLLMREAYAAWSKQQRANAVESSTMWQLSLGAAGVGGLLVPLAYFWTAVATGSLVDLHIYRCVVSMLIVLLLSYYFYEDTINGLQGLGVLLSVAGLVVVLSSTELGTKQKIRLTV
jgi:uncharacterized membrane protein